MSSRLTIPLGHIPQAFNNAGVDQAHMVMLLAHVTHLWLHHSVQSTDIMDLFCDTNLTEFEFTVLSNEASDKLVEVFNTFKDFQLDKTLISWKFLPHAIVIEVENPPTQMAMRL